MNIGDKLLCKIGNGPYLSFTKDKEYEIVDIYEGGKEIVLIDNFSQMSRITIHQVGIMFFSQKELRNKKIKSILKK